MVRKKVLEFSKLEREQKLQKSEWDEGKVSRGADRPSCPGMGSGKGRVATFAQKTQHYIQKHVEHYIWQNTEYYIQKTPPLAKL